MTKLPPILPPLLAELSPMLGERPVLTPARQAHLLSDAGLMLDWVRAGAAVALVKELLENWPGKADAVVFQVVSGDRRFAAVLPLVCLPGTCPEDRQWNVFNDETSARCQHALEAKADSLCALLGVEKNKSPSALFDDLSARTQEEWRLFATAACPSGLASLLKQWRLDDQIGPGGLASSKPRL